MRLYVRYDSVSSCRKIIRYLSAVTVPGVDSLILNSAFVNKNVTCTLHIDRMLMLMSQQDIEIEENNIFNKILRCVLYFNTKGTATIKPLIAIGEPFTCTTSRPFH